MNSWSTRRWLAVSVLASIGVAGFWIWAAHAAGVVTVRLPGWPRG